MSTASAGVALTETDWLRHLLTGWVAGGVEFIQVREKDLGPDELLSLVEAMVAGVQMGRTKLLLNVPPSPAWSQAIAAFAAAAAHVDGVHLPGSPTRRGIEQAREAFALSGRAAIVSTACHTVEQVEVARAGGADLALFAPVFEKISERAGKKSVEDPVRGDPDETTLPGQGIGALRQVCQAAGDMPVFALGGVTPTNATECIAAGAAGVAGIRLFAGEAWRALVAEGGARR